MTKSKTMAELRDKLATKARDRMFQMNPDGFHVSPHCNEEILAEFFEDGFDACDKIRREQIKLLIKAIQKHELLPEELEKIYRYSEATYINLKQALEEFYKDNPEFK